MRAIRDFADAHRDCAGFTDMYIRKLSPHGLQELGIGRSALGNIVERHLPLHEDVTTGYSTHVEAAPSTIGFGGVSACCLFVGLDNAGTVRIVWLQLWPDNLLYFDAMRGALADLGESYDLIVADWESGELFALRDRDALLRYLAARLSPATGPLHQSQASG
jgi:hypothetical protein